MIIHHVTLITGDVATHRLDTIDPRAIRACRALLPSGGPIPHCSPFRVEVLGPVFSVWRAREPIVTCGLGEGVDETWEALQELQKRSAPVLATPPASRWLAVAILPGITAVSKNDISWLGDFERCMAAAILLPK